MKITEVLNELEGSWKGLYYYAVTYTPRIGVEITDELKHILQDVRYGMLKNLPKKDVSIYMGF